MVPESIKVGGILYKIDLTDETLVLNSQECRGAIDYENQVIKINNSRQGSQGVELTFCHELIHAIRYERNLDWGDKDELYTEELGRGLYQVLKDNELRF